MKLNILFINDVHGYLDPHPELFYDEDGETVQTAGGYARIATLVKQVREQNPHTLFFDGGDTLHGTKPLVDSKGGVIIPILNALRLDAMVGHWDFGYGPERLKELSGQLDFPVLGSNVFNEDGTAFFSPTALFEKEGITIGVIGICAMIVDKVMPEKMSRAIHCTSGKDELPGHIQHLKNRGADIIILLSHNGFPQDVAVLKEVAGIDVCLSAHTHNRIYKAIEINGSRIVQCGCHGSFLGNLTLEIEGTKIRDYQYELIKVAGTVPEEPEVGGMVKTIKEQYQGLRNTILGSTDQILHRYSTINSTLDELLLRAISFITETEIAFSNGWRFGIPIPAGNITENDLYNITPMNPPVSVVDLTGLEIKEMLEENLERTFSADPLGQMGGYVKRCFGLQVNMRIENPAGHRIQEIYHQGSHLDLNKSYQVSFVTMQGVGKKYGKNRREHAKKAVEAMKDYLKAYPEYSPGQRKTYYLV